jgi:hypothetical protein
MLKISIYRRIQDGKKGIQDALLRLQDAFIRLQDANNKTPGC